MILLSSSSIIVVPRRRTVIVAPTSALDGDYLTDDDVDVDCKSCSNLALEMSKEPHCIIVPATAPSGAFGHYSGDNISLTVFFEQIAQNISQLWKALATKEQIKELIDM